MRAADRAADLKVMSTVQLITMSCVYAVLHVRICVCTTLSLRAL